MLGFALLPHTRESGGDAQHRRAILSPSSLSLDLRGSAANSTGHRSRTITGFSEDVKAPDPLEMAGILAWFWNERFWLPHNVTWADLKNTDESSFPQAEDLYLACPLAFCMFMIRLLFERYDHHHHHHRYCQNLGDVELHPQRLRVMLGQAALLKNTIQILMLSIANTIMNH